MDSLADGAESRADEPVGGPLFRETAAFGG
jgi:hypothetical protein